VILPHGLRLLESRMPELLTRIAAALGAADPTPELASARTAHLAAKAHVGRLTALGVTEEHIPVIVEQAALRAELQNMSDPPNPNELTALLHDSL
jgi:alcohol dehydrogenase class IV